MRPELDNAKSTGRVIHQGWVEKRGKSMFGANWRKQWFILYTNGNLCRFQERPKSLFDKKKPTRTYSIGPESKISREDDSVQFTWGEKRKGTLEKRVFRPLQEDRDEKIEGPKRTNPDTEKWFRMLTEIALRKRLQFVIRNRSAADDEKTPSGIKLWSKGKKKISHFQGNKVKDKFHEDKRKLWVNAVRFDRTTNGDKIYFEFANYNLEILWKIYTGEETYLTKIKIKDFLMDAFVVAAKESKEVNSMIPLYLDERAYLAKIYLDQDMDGKVKYDEFLRVNQKQFWLDIDFLSPIDENAATVGLWMLIFNSLEKEGELSKEIIYRAFEKYDFLDEGFLYQQDIENFLIDFMYATKSKWPAIKIEKIEQFCDTIVVRGAIALRYLDKDETGRVTREEFNEIGNAEFWSHVDYLTAVDTLDAQLTGFKEYNANEDIAISPESLPVHEMIEANFNNFVSYTTEREMLHTDTFSARPSFSKAKYLSPSRTALLNSDSEDIPGRGQAISKSCLDEEDIDVRLIDSALLNIGVDQASLSPEFHQFPSDEESDNQAVKIDIEFDEEYDCRGEDV